jgi:hypothetical protein
MVSTLKYLIPLALGVVLALFIARSCEDPAPEWSEIDSLTLANKDLRAKFNKLQAEDSVILHEERLRVDSFKVALKKKEDRIAYLKAHPTVKEIRVAYPVVDTLIVTQDSVITDLQEELAVQAQERQQERRRFVDMLDTKQQENTNLTGINQSLAAYNKSLEKGRKWDKVEVWVWRGLGAGGVVWGLTR